MAVATAPPDAGCSACGSGRAAVLHRSARTGHEVARCADCGLVFLLATPDPAELDALYASPAAYRGYLDEQQAVDLRRRRLLVLHRLRELVGSPGPPRLFDVGAGAGDFLALARDRGFDVGGNEISDPAVEEAARRHGIALHRGDLAALDLDGVYDAVTLWCVLAHVADPGALLGQARRLLRPGGVLYLHTPRWCLIDTAGLAAARVGGPALGRVLDRRLNTAHLRLYRQGTMVAALAAAGLDVVRVQPAVGYSLVTGSYLASLGVPVPLRRAAAAPLDLLIGRGWFVRNILDVYARRPRR